jgi:hypothetical protein
MPTDILFPNESRCSSCTYRVGEWRAWMWCPEREGSGTVRIVPACGGSASHSNDRSTIRGNTRT